jgi:TolB-like protein/DNA-binding winged helix-turn-helix (wHTH) protein/Tfp pilus assembly protein PilF
MRVARFGLFEADFEQRILTKGGLRVKLQDQPFQVLEMLLERPGELVARDEIQQRLWPADTFVEFDDGLNTAIKKLRAALGDSSDNPRFVETIPRRGYRFLAATKVEISVRSAELAETQETLPSGLGPVSSKSAPALTEVPGVVSADNISPGGPNVTIKKVKDDLNGSVEDSKFIVTAGSGAGAPHAAPGRHLARPGWMLAAVAMAVLFAFGLWFFEFQPRHHDHSEIHSLAVLPLQNLSPDSNQEYFADGITEELITNLAQSLPLRVISRTSIMRYKRTSEPITQIGRELGVEAIVEGSVLRSGDRVAVTVQLIDAREDRHLWAQRYDRKLGDLMGMEEDLSLEIAKQIGGRLSHEVNAASLSHPVDLQVYELCLLGRYHWNKRSGPNLAKSIEYFQQAIDRDPSYAPAYAGLANAYALLSSYDSVGMRESYAKAAAAAHRALELDDSLAEPHATLGFIAIGDETADFMQAGQEFRRALELNPNLATAHHWFAFHLFFSDQPDKALAEIEQARQLDPLSAIINADEGHFLYAVKRYQEAKTRLQRAIELDPGLGQPHESLALIDIAEGDTGDALREAHTGLALDRANPRTMAEAGYVFAATGHTDEAGKLLATLNDLVRRSLTTPVFEAFINIGLGQRSAAVQALEESTNPNLGGRVAGLGQWLFFDELDGDPRYQRFLAESKAKMFRPSSPASPPQAR